MELPFTVKTAEGSVVFSKNADGSTTTVNGGFGYDGTTIIPLTADEISAIEDAVAGRVEDLERTEGTVVFEVTLPDTDTSVPVSPN